MTPVGADIAVAVVTALGAVIAAWVTAARPLLERLDDLEDRLGAVETVLDDHVESGE